MVDTTVLGISLQEGGNTPVLLLFLHNTRKILSLKVGALEAFAISAALSEMDCPAEENDNDDLSPSEGTKDGPASDTPELFSRPLVHQLLQKSIHSLGGSLIAVEISVTADEELASRLVLKGHEGEDRLDCRPSDGIAIAIRCDAKVRVSLEMAAQAQDIDVVMPALSEDLRTIVAAKLLALRGDKGLAPIRDSLLFSALQTTRGQIRKSMVEVSRKLIKQSLEGVHLADVTEPASKEKAITTEGAVKRYQANPVMKHRAASPPVSKNTSLPAQKQATPPPAPKQIDDEDDSTTMEVVPGQTIVLPSPQGGKAPTIRISLVRQPAEGEAEALDEIMFPSSGIARETLGALSLSRDDVKAIGNARSEEDRLTTLLRLLAPETKVPM